MQRHFFTPWSGFSFGLKILEVLEPKTIISVWNALYTIWSYLFELLPVKIGFSVSASDWHKAAVQWEVDTLRIRVKFRCIRKVLENCGRREMNLKEIHCTRSVQYTQCTSTGKISFHLLTNFKAFGPYFETQARISEVELKRSCEQGCTRFVMVFVGSGLVDVWLARTSYKLAMPLCDLQNY